MRFHWKDILKAVGAARVVGPGPLRRQGLRVVTDSRETQPGDLFVALPGTKCDGHEFLSDAFRRGAAAAVVESGVRCPGFCCLEVPDRLTALWELAAWSRDRVPAVRIGVTGSYGKTTTREMIYSVLSADGPATQSPRNFNNHVGVPLSLLAMSPGDRYGVFEVAASGRREIGPLSQLVQPHVAVLTGLGRAHLGGFGSRQVVAHEKRKLLESVGTNGLGVMPAECLEQLGDPRSWWRGQELVTVGTGRDADVRARRVQFDSRGLHFWVDGTKFRVPVGGSHFLPCILAALTVARWQGVPDRATSDALLSFEPPSGRCRVARIGSRTVIDDSYNASPESMLAACRALGEWPTTGRRVLVLGDMAELGDEAGACHEEVGAVVGAARLGATGSGDSKGRIDDLWAVGGFSERLVRAATAAGMPDGRARSVATVDELIQVLPSWLGPGDTVLVKGARVHHMERVVQSVSGGVA